MRLRIAQFARLCVRQFATLFLGVALSFLALLGLPDAAYQRAGPFATETVLIELRGQLGLDRPPVERFFTYWQRLASGELRSFYTQEPLLAVFPEKLDHTVTVLMIALCALVVFTAGWFLLFRAFPKARTALGLLVGTTAAVPVFISGTLLMFLATFAHIPYWIAAGLSLAIFPSILVATNLEHRWAAISHSYYHALALHYRVSPPALIARAVREFAPVAVLVGNALAFYLVAGVAIVELIFGIPGMGRWMLESLLRVDLPVIFLTVVVASVSASLVLFASNLFALWADPRHTPQIVPS